MAENTMNGCCPQMSCGCNGQTIYYGYNNCGSNKLTLKTINGESLIGSGDIRITHKFKSNYVKDDAGEYIQIIGEGDVILGTIKLPPLGGSSVDLSTLKLGIEGNTIQLYNGDTKLGEPVVVTHPIVKWDDIQDIPPIPEAYNDSELKKSIEELKGVTHIIGSTIVKANTPNPDNQGLEDVEHIRVILSSQKIGSAPTTLGAISLLPATQEQVGLMTPQDKIKLDSFYFKPAANGHMHLVIKTGSGTDIVEKEYELVEHIDIKKYTLTLKVTPTGAGTVRGGGTYNEGSTVTITATPNSGYKFVNWSDNNTNATRELTLNSDVNLTATFVASTVTYGGSASLTPTNPSKLPYTESSVKFTATSNVTKNVDGVATSFTPSYEWYVDGVKQKSTSNTFTLIRENETDNEATYKVKCLIKDGNTSTNIYTNEVTVTQAGDTETVDFMVGETYTIAPEEPEFDLQTFLDTVGKNTIELYGQVYPSNLKKVSIKKSALDKAAQDITIGSEDPNDTTQYMTSILAYQGEGYSTYGISKEGTLLGKNQWCNALGVTPTDTPTVVSRDGYTFMYVGGLPHHAIYHLKINKD